MSIPNTIKTLVIQKWLEGFDRDIMASDIGISAGMMSNIVTEARNPITDLDLMRTLALKLRKKDLK